MSEPDRRRGTPPQRHRPPGTLDAWLATPLGVLALAALAAGGPAAAYARSATISPGDEIDTGQRHGGTRCTLGYTFADPGTYINYGITAGHCNK